MPCLLMNVAISLVIFSVPVIHVFRACLSECGALAKFGCHGEHEPIIGFWGQSPQRGFRDSTQNEHGGNRHFTQWLRGAEPTVPMPRAGCGALYGAKVDYSHRTLPPTICCSVCVFVSVSLSNALWQKWLIGY